MKKIIVIILYLYSLGLFSQCLEPNNGFICIPERVYFFTSNTGIVAGLKKDFENRMIIRTTDGGDFWSETYRDFMPYFMHFLNGKLYVSGQNTLLISSDEGMNWQYKHINVEPYGAAVQFVNNDTAFAACGAWFYGATAKTTNGGDDWFFLPVDSLNQLTGLSFVNPSTGIMVGREEILLTTTGGAKWEESTERFNYWLTPVKMLNDNLIFAAGIWSSGPIGKQVITKSTNGGFNWTNIHEFNYEIASAAFVDSVNFFVCGDFGRISVKHPEDSNWIEKSFGEDVYFIDVFALNRDTAWVVGHVSGFGPIMLKTTNGGRDWISMTEITTVPTENEVIKCYPNPFNFKTTIRYVVKEDSKVQIDIYDALGRNIRTFDEGRKNYGYYEVEFDGTSLPSGIYFCRLRVGRHDKSDAIKIVLLK